jgi:hypothetical protein
MSSPPEGGSVLSFFLSFSLGMDLDFFWGLASGTGSSGGMA